MAADTAQEALENQLKLDQAKQTPKVTRYIPGDPMTGIGSYTYEIDNPAIAKYEEKGKELDAKITKFYELATASEAEGADKLKKAGIKGAEGYATGTVGAYEAAITKKQAELKNISDAAEYKKTVKEIAELQKLVDKITGDTKKTPSGGAKQADPFTEQLEARKKQYQEYSKWINSTNEDIRAAAKTEFASLIKEGEDYGAYLKNLKAQLEALPASTNRDKQIAFVTTEIVNTEKSTYTNGYKKDLEEQLALADSLLEKLSIIAEKRKELDAPNVEMKSEKSTILDTQQSDIVQKTKDELQQAKQAYSDYLAEKVNYEVRYWEKRKALELQIEQETNEGRKQIYQDMLNTLNTNRELKYTVDYDALVDEYKTYQQKCADIAADFDEKIALATAQKNEALVAKLQEAKNNPFFGGLRRTTKLRYVPTTFWQFG